MGQKDLIEVLKKIATQYPAGRTVAAPHRDRKLAVKALESDLVKHLAKHIIKITLWPKLPAYNGWVEEINTCLTELTFRLCRFCVDDQNDERIIKKLWFGSKELMNHLNEVMDEAYWEVKDDMKKENNGKIPHIEYNPFTAKDQNFSDMGFKIKEEKSSEKGIYFTLWLKSVRIV